MSQYNSYNSYNDYNEQYEKTKLFVQPGYDMFKFLCFCSGCLISKYKKLFCKIKKRLPIKATFQIDFSKHTNRKFYFFGVMEFSMNFVTSRFCFLASSLINLFSFSVNLMFNCVTLFLTFFGIKF